MQDTNSNKAVPIPPNALLWRQGLDIYDGKKISRFDVATTGTNAPIIPGINRTVKPGEYFVSPAMAELLKKAPVNQLAKRFEGKMAGQIDRAGLRSPGELLIIVGHTPAEMHERFSYLGHLTELQSIPEVRNYDTMTIATFLVIVGGLLFAIWSMVMTATRLGAARREEKFATLRLFGATPQQINVIAAVDAALGTAIGLGAAIVLFYVLQPFFGRTLAGLMDVYPDQFTPGPLGLTLITVGVLVASVTAALLSLRRVRLSPLGASRKTAPKPPGAWRILPLLLGLGVITTVWLINKDIADTLQKAKLTRLFLGGFTLTLLGIALSGSWLTQQITRLFAKLAIGAPSLLAARRLADNPKAAFRNVNTLVIAAFLATLFAALTPLLLAPPNPAQKQQPSIQHVYFSDRYFANRGGLQPSEAKQALQSLREVPGVTVVSWHAETITENSLFESATFMRCDDLKGRQFSHLSLCEQAAPDAVVHLPANSKDSTQPNQPQIVPQAGLVQKDISNLPIHSFELLINAGQAEVDQVRTIMAEESEIFRNGFMWMTPQELAAENAQLAQNVKLIVNGIMLVILFVAGCSLAVTAGGSIVERKRPFGLLRVAGMSARQLKRVVLYESAIPLVASTVIASGLGYLVGVLMIQAFAHPSEITVQPLTLSFYGLLSLGIAAALLVIMATLPLLNALTKPENARFE